MRPVVNTEKHYTQFSLATTAAGAITNITLVNAVAAPSSGEEVREGAVISAVYIEMWVHSDDAASGTIITTLEKVGQGTASMNTTEAADLSAYANKKNVLHTQMGLIGNNVTYPMATIKGWFKIPKGKQRFGLSDRLNLNIFAQSNGLSRCGFATYKEQY